MQEELYAEARPKNQNARPDSGQRRTGTPQRKSRKKNNSESTHIIKMGRTPVAGKDTINAMAKGEKPMTQVKTKTRKTREQTTTTRKG